MPCKQKAKGNNFERKVCDLFSEVFGLNFERTPTSGAFVGGKNAARLSRLSNSQTLLVRGDIIVPDELSNLIIECKSRKDFTFHQLLQGDCTELNKWLGQVIIDFKKCGEVGIFLVLFKINQKGIYVVYPRLSDLELLPKQNVLHYTYKDSENVEEVFNIIQYSDEWLKYNENNFLKICKKE